MAEQQQDGGYVPVEVGAELWSASESWKDDNAPQTRNYVVTAVRPKTLLVSGAVATAWQERDRRYERSPDTPENAASGAVARTPYGWLYRTEIDAVRALVRKTEQAVERAELRAQQERELRSGALELLKKLGGGAAAILAIVLVALAAPSPAAAQSSGFQPGVNAVSVSGRTLSVYGAVSRILPLGRGRTATVRVLLYRAPRGGAPGVLIARSAARTVRARDVRVGVTVRSTRRPASREFVWFGVIQYTVKTARGRSLGTFRGIGSSRSLRLR